LPNPKLISKSIQHATETCNAPCSYSYARRLKPMWQMQ